MGRNAFALLRFGIAMTALLLCCVSALLRVTDSSEILTVLSAESSRRELLWRRGHELKLKLAPAIPAARRAALLLVLGHLLGLLLLAVTDFISVKKPAPPLRTTP
jgi:hypothetical protein